MRVSSHETWPSIFRKRINGINVHLVSTGIVLWQPPRGVEIAILSAFTRTRERVHTIGSLTAPTITVDNGTDAQNVVANVAVQGPAGTSFRLAVIGSFLIDYDRPLRLLIPVASDTTGAHRIDLIFSGMKISA